MLDKGWFRSQNSMYESHITYSDEQLWNSIKIRIRLDQWNPEQSKSWQKIKKNHSKFRTEINPLLLELAHYELFDFYRLKRFEDEFGNLSDVLGGDDKKKKPSFPSYIINIWEEEKLIGSGIFDLGITSALGYLFYYDPNYMKYSLGKQLIYSMMEYCQSHKILYFYPGYYLPGMASMEYKLKLAPDFTEFLELRSYNWKPLGLFSSLEFHLETMHGKLLEKESEMAQKGYICKIIVDDLYPYYPFLMECISGWDAPFCMICYKPKSTPELIAIGYDVRISDYQYFKFEEDGTPNFWAKDEEIRAIYTVPMIPINSEEVI
jgi:arginine-tRNA-protein transferase